MNESGEESEATESPQISIIAANITGIQEDPEYPKAVKLNGRYMIPWKTTTKQPSTMNNFTYFFTSNLSKVPSEKELDAEPLMQLVKPNPARIISPPCDGIRITWLGHATVLIQFDHINVLVNPKFTERHGKLHHAGSQKRYRPPVYKIEELPPIDFVFITNTHLDYLDLPSIRQLNTKYGNTILWYVPAGASRWIYEAGCLNVIEKEWWLEEEVMFLDQYYSDSDYDNSEKTLIRIACTPSQNYHSRVYCKCNDENVALWCSWVVISPRYKVFISGATGYNDKIFKLIGTKYGPIDLAVLPIGGYDPDWKFSFSNVTPEQAVQIHKDVTAIHSIGVSWGTFTVSNEYYLEPAQRLRDEWKKQNLTEKQFFILKHGESRVIRTNMPEPKFVEANPDRNNQEDSADDDDKYFVPTDQDVVYAEYVVSDSSSSMYQV